MISLSEISTVSCFFYRLSTVLPAMCTPNWRICTIYWRWTSILWNCTRESRLVWSL